MASRNVNEFTMIKELNRRVRRLERANPLSSSSLGRGRMRFYDGSVLLIENGALNVTGTATISGVLDVSGRTNLKGQTSVTGPMEISGTTNITGNTNILGELNVTGPTTLDGLTEIGGDTSVTGKLDVTGPMATKGTLSVEGMTTLKNDLNITQGGKLKAGNLEIEPANGGQINFLGGGIAASPTFGLVVTHNLGVRINGPSVTIPVDVKAGAEANVHIDAAGRLWRV